MVGRTRGLRRVVTGGAMAVVLVTAATVLVGCSSAERSSEVLALLPIESTTTTEPTATDLAPLVAPATLPSTTLPPTTAGPATTARPATTTTVARAVRAATTTAAPRTVATTSPKPAPTTTAAPARQSGRVDESSDNGYAISYSADERRGEGSATALVRGEVNRLRYMVGGSIDADGMGTFTATMTNKTDKDIRFPGGLDLRWIVQQDGKDWKTLHLTRPDITVLKPGSELNSSVRLPVNGYGRYTFTGMVPVEYP